jgi:hypothetical protein
MQKQITKSVLCSLVAALAVLAMASPAFAQLPPPISPWMGMFDRPRSELGNYLGNVRPQQNLMRAAASHANQLQSQQRALQAMQQSQGLGGAGTRNLMEGAAAPPGGASSMRDVLPPPREIPRAQRHPAGFNQYLHYYPAHSLPRRPVPNFSPAGSRR